MVFSAGLWEVCAVLAAIVPLIVFRLDKGWLFVIYGVAGLVQETYRRSRWRARGYPWDPRWAVVWQPTGTNP